jgi:hypothetical protein
LIDFLTGLTLEFFAAERAGFVVRAAAFFRGG